MYSVGDVVQGTTKQHGGRVEIVDTNKTFYLTRLVGGGHVGGKSRYITRVTIENNYTLVRKGKPKRKGQK